MSEKDAATVLEDAADLLLIRGVCRDGTFGRPGRERCALGAISEVVGADITECSGYHTEGTELYAAARAALYSSDLIGDRTIQWWNDSSDDDFEVIDTLRRVAKDLRNAS